MREVARLKHGEERRFSFGNRQDAVYGILRGWYSFRKVRYSCGSDEAVGSAA